MTKEEIEKRIITMALSGTPIPDIMFELSISKKELLLYIRNISIKFSNPDDFTIKKALNRLINKENTSSSHSEFPQEELEAVANYIIENNLSLRDSEKELVKVFGKYWDVCRQTVFRRLNRIEDINTRIKLGEHFEINKSNNTSLRS